MEIAKVRLDASRGMRTDVDSRFLADNEVQFMQNWDIVGRDMVVPRGGTNLLSRSSAHHQVLPGKVIYDFWFISQFGTFIGAIVTKAGTEDRIYIRNITSPATTPWTQISTAGDSDNGAQHDMTLGVNGSRWQGVRVPNGIMLVYEGNAFSNAIFTDSVNHFAYRGHTLTFLSGFITLLNPHYTEYWGNRIWWVENGIGEPAKKVQYTGIGSVGMAVNGTATSAGFVTLAVDGPISGIKGYKDRLYIWTRNQLGMIYSTDSASPYDQLKFVFKIIDDGVGCVSGNSIVIENERIMWLCDEGIAVGKLSPFVNDSLEVKTHNKIPELFHNLVLHGNYNACFLQDRQEYYITGLSPKGGALV